MGNLNQENCYWKELTEPARATGDGLIPDFSAIWTTYLLLDKDSSGFTRY